MPSVDLTPRLARESRPGDGDTFLFDKSRDPKTTWG